MEPFIFLKLLPKLFNFVIVHFLNFSVVTAVYLQECFVFLRNDLPNKFDKYHISTYGLEGSILRLYLYFCPRFVFVSCWIGLWIFNFFFVCDNFISILTENYSKILFIGFTLFILLDGSELGAFSCANLAPIIQWIIDIFKDVPKIVVGLLTFPIIIK